MRYYYKMDYPLVRYIGLNQQAADTAAEFSFCPLYYRGKNAILIDDVVTRGRTLSGTGERILHGGAVFVIGLFVARTINPDWAV